ncbi:hypothetical protein R70211_02315 [Paraburkholderia domus]|uniref:Uncharacterized protein n=1 Tax=Paraburkholderia domus TaxID=2793075 RepID=A0A9N8QWC6_9BURK|nr:hypothetical protein R75483_01896 [Paraburkholderia domus]CAE6884258.1 hypothetical protein R70211_02315 [Paraburkholderia domus]
MLVRSSLLPTNRDIHTTPWRVIRVGRFIVLVQQILDCAATYHAFLAGPTKASNAARAMGTAWDDIPVESVRGPLPRRPMRNEVPTLFYVCAGTIRSLLPLSRLPAHQSRLPTRDAQWHTRMFSFKHAIRIDLHDECGRLSLRGQRRFARSGERHACLTFNRGLTAVQLRALSIDKRARAPKSGQFRSGLRVRQEWLIHAQTVLLSAGYCPMRELFFIIWSIKACTKRCCYVSKRDNCRNLRHSALKCDVFRGRSRCSPNSKHFHRISAS